MSTFDIVMWIVAGVLGCFVAGFFTGCSAQLRLIRIQTEAIERNDET